MSGNNIDELYSSEGPEQWKQILGEELHYHFGDFSGDGLDFDEGLQQVIRRLYGEIPPRSRVLDAGCGWGGSARFLTNELQCEVDGITVSQVQAEYCRSIGLSVLLGDLESMNFEDCQYDAILMIESLEHIQLKSDLLSRLRHLAPKIILRTNCVARLTPNLDPGAFQMYLETPETIQRRLEKSGWSILRMTDRRVQALPTFEHWASRLEQVYKEAEPPGQIGVLRKFCEYARLDLKRWADAHPLMEIVAI